MVRTGRRCRCFSARQSPVAKVSRLNKNTREGHIQLFPAPVTVVASASSSRHCEPSLMPEVKQWEVIRFPAFTVLWTQLPVDIQLPRKHTEQTK
ncbi:hypothetical protein A6R68_23352 [Neotoma lepida]|uniref:Uncharacterized protein n=1 Tax=Neotoma lepida TaxID=56216 RepID=A0A1A6HW29_NEOLE|nr:hypothetical protein A6R68_23352 [Neotoma lepida]